MKSMTYKYMRDKVTFRCLKNYIINDKRSQTAAFTALKRNIVSMQEVIFSTNNLYHSGNSKDEIPKTICEQWQTGK